MYVIKITKSRKVENVENVKNSIQRKIKVLKWKSLVPNSNSVLRTILCFTIN